MEVPTEVGEATLEDPLGEEQSVDVDRQAVYCQNRARAYRVTAGEDLTNEGEEVPTMEVPPDEG